MKNYVQPGDNVTVAATFETASGDFVMIGKLYGFAVMAAETGEMVAISRKGVYTVAKPSLETWSVGDEVKFDSVTETFTNDPASTAPVVAVCVEGGDVAKIVLV